MALPDADQQTSYSLTLGDRGRLVLPSELRRRLELNTGDRMIATVEDGGVIRIVSARQLARQLRGLYADIPGSMADALIAERRAEAQKEE